MLADAGVEDDVGEDGAREHRGAPWVAIEELVTQVERDVPEGDLSGGTCEGSAGGGARTPNVVAVFFVENLRVCLKLTKYSPSVRRINFVACELQKHTRICVMKEGGGHINWPFPVTIPSHGSFSKSISSRL